MIHTTLAAMMVATGMAWSGAALVAPSTGLLQAQAQLSHGRATDTSSSGVNTELTCDLAVEMAGAEALLRWTVTGAVAIGLSPASAMEGGLALVGERIVDVSERSWIHLTALDAAGERIRCSVMIGGATSGSDTLSDPVTGGGEVAGPGPS